MIETQYGDCSVKEEDVEQFRSNDLFFRSPVSMDNYRRLRRIGFDDVAEIENYNSFVALYPAVIFIDLKDIAQYIEINKINGLDNEDLNKLVEIVLEHFGEQDMLHEIIWSEFADKLANVLAAKLNLDYNDVLLGDVFNKCMENLFAIALVVINYLVNANTPIVDNLSLYKIGKINQGLIGLQCRSFKELSDDFCAD